MNKNSTVKKIIDFRRGAEFYFRQAEKFLDAGDYFSALDNLRDAIKADPDDAEYRLLLAETFFEMELYEEACDEYFRLLAAGKNELECCFYLTQIFMEEDNPEAAAYYLKRTYTAQKNGLDRMAESAARDEDELENLYALADALEENAKELERPRFAVAYDKKESHRNMIYAAVNLMRRGEFAHALEMLAAVPETADCHVDALNNKAMCEYSLNRYKKAWETTGAADALDKENIFTICNRLLVARALKYKDAEEGLLKRLEEADGDWSDAELYRAAMTMCELKEHRRAAYYFDELLRGIFDPEIMILAAVAFYNDGHADKARRLALDALKINPDDTVARWYAKRFRARPGARALHYVPQVQPKEGGKRAVYLVGLCALPRETFLIALEDERTREYIRWALTTENTACILKLFSQMAGTEFGDRLAEKLFLERGCMTLLKKFVLQEYLVLRRSARVNLVVNDVFKTVRFTLPASMAGLPTTFRQAYINAFSTLAIMEADFETRLLTVFKDFLKAAAPLSGKLTNSDALAAALSFQYGELKIFRDKPVLCEIYHIKQTTLRLYLKLLNLR
ncbi:MAG: hypothetical protein LBL66_02870 [Clostridiales bacterium]|jgi:tetratricopeptide (TPR) repeat protein|nr:hypothetical protein [Clostridiales bacterium]